MKKLTIPNEDLLSEVGRMVAEGVAVTLRGKGNSMLPFIVGGRDAIVLGKADTLKKGDIVLARINDGHYVLHRIIRIEKERVTLMGDGNLTGTEQCTTADILAKAGAILRNGKHIMTGSRSEQAKAALWYRLRPIRRWLLAIYRRCA